MPKQPLSLEHKKLIDDARAELEVAKTEERVAAAKLKAAWAKLHALQGLCDHVNAYPTYCMGEQGTTCPDCGYNR